MRIEDRMITISRRHTRAETLNQERDGLGRWRFSLPRFGPHHVHLLERDIDVPRWPREFDGLRVAHLTDLHRGPYVPQYYIERIVEIANDQNPDVVVLTGDFVYGPNWKGHQRALQALGRLESKLGTFAVLGNHDWRYRANGRIIRELTNEGIQVVENRHALVQTNGRVLAIAGVEDEWASSPCLATATQGLEADAMMLLTHNPDFVDDPKRLSASAMLPNIAFAGHTHGGQVLLRKWGAPHVAIRNRRFLSGLVELDDFPIYISRGLGVVAVPLRMNCPAELPILRLRCSDSKADE